MMTVAARVLDRIRSDIVSGQIRSGTRLKIDYLAARYKSSHMPVREALRHLEGEGLVQKASNGGARVKEITVDMIRAFFEVRASIESMLARRAAARATAADIDRLDAAQAQLERCAANLDLSGVVAWNRRFHNIIEVIGEQAEAAALANRQCDLLDSLWLSCGVDHRRLPGVNSDHRYIIQALRERDPETAAVLVTAHTIKGRQDLIRQLQNAAVVSH